MTSFFRILFIGWILVSPVHAAETDNTFEDAIAAHDRGDYTTAMKLLRPLAERGDVAAQTGLGFMYNLGQGVEQDFNQALSWFQKAAEQGDALAESGLGFMYQSGQGVTQSYQQAEKWYRRAANKGLPLAQYRLGLFYKNGTGINQDFIRAYQWISLAANDLPEAQKALDEIAPHLTPQQISAAQKQAATCKTTQYKNCD